MAHETIERQFVFSGVLNEYPLSSVESEYLSTASPAEIAAIAEQLSQRAKFAEPNLFMVPYVAERSPMVYDTDTGSIVQPPLSPDAMSAWIYIQCEHGRAWVQLTSVRHEGTLIRCGPLEMVEDDYRPIFRLWLGLLAELKRLDLLAIDESTPVKDYKWAFNEIEGKCRPPDDVFDEFLLDQGIDHAVNPLDADKWKKKRRNFTSQMSYYRRK